MQYRKTFWAFLNNLWILGAYLFLYLPIIVLVVFSFNKAAFPAPWQGCTLKWYQELYSASQLWHALFNSLIVSTISTLLSLVMGISFIYYGVRGGRIHNFFALLYGNLIVPEVVLAVGLLSLFTFFAIPLGLITLIVAHTVLGIGYIVPLLYIRYSEIDRRLIEASLDLGASITQTFFTIILPLLKPAIIAGGLLAFIISFDDFILSYFCAGSEAQTLSLYILSMLRSEISPVINALSTLLLIISSTLVLIFCSTTIRSRLL